mmetsp:Transcript_19743/g.46982  ORF Transcript_19743/g.46982 Transcript_19743/m.46982 type:complete len:200 (+) Transcript_19743:594-1193(+)
MLQVMFLVVCLLYLFGVLESLFRILHRRQLLRRRGPCHVTFELHSVDLHLDLGGVFQSHLQLARPLPTACPDLNVLGAGALRDDMAEDRQRRLVVRASRDEVAEDRQRVLLLLLLRRVLEVSSNAPVSTLPLGRRPESVHPRGHRPEPHFIEVDASLQEQRFDPRVKVVTSVADKHRPGVLVLASVFGSFQRVEIPPFV